MSVDASPPHSHLGVARQHQLCIRALGCVCGDLRCPVDYPDADGRAIVRDEGGRVLDVLVTTAADTVADCIYDADLAAGIVLAGSSRQEDMHGIAVLSLAASKSWVPKNARKSG